MEACRSSLPWPCSNILMPGMRCAPSTSACFMAAGFSTPPAPCHLRARTPAFLTGQRTTCAHANPVQPARATPSAHTLGRPQVGVRRPETAWDVATFHDPEYSPRQPGMQETLQAHRGSGTTLASRQTAPATTGDATEVPDRLRQPPWMRLPRTSRPYATTSGCRSHTRRSEPACVVTV